MREGHNLWFAEAPLLGNPQIPQISPQILLKVLKFSSFLSTCRRNLVVSTFKPTLMCVVGRHLRNCIKTIPKSAKQIFQTQKLISRSCTRPQTGCQVLPSAHLDQTAVHHTWTGHSVSITNPQHYNADVQETNLSCQDLWQGAGQSAKYFCLGVWEIFHAWNSRHSTITPHSHWVCQQMTR